MVVHHKRKGFLVNIFLYQPHLVNCHLETPRLNVRLRSWCSNILRHIGLILCLNGTEKSLTLPFLRPKRHFRKVPQISHSHTSFIASAFFSWNVLPTNSMSLSCWRLTLYLIRESSAERTDIGQHRRAVDEFLARHFCHFLRHFFSPIEQGCCRIYAHSYSILSSTTILSQGLDSAAFVRWHLLLHLRLAFWKRMTGEGKAVVPTFLSFLQNM